MTMFPMRLPSARRLFPVAAAAALLAGCAIASYEPTNVHPGDTREHVIAVMGPPSATHALVGNRDRLEYNHMPAGLQTYMVDLDASGHVIRWEQVLDEKHFARIRPGMSVDDVSALLGTPTQRNHYVLPTASDAWSYRYQSIQKCVVFVISFDPQTHRVLPGSSNEPDPRCGMTE